MTPIAATVPWVSTATDRPILLLATAQRCGSTFLQRLLSTHPAAFIWGEHDGQLDPILTAVDAFADWDKGMGNWSHKEFSRRGTGGFMSNITPPETVLREQTQALIGELFRRLPDNSPVPVDFRWGFKEVRYGGDFVRRFLRYFPGTRVLYLTRDPIAVLRSLDWWEQTTNGFWTREKTSLALDRWRDINASFLDAPDLSDAVLPVRYEKLTGDAETTLKQIAEFLDIDPSLLDRTVLDDKVHGPSPGGRAVRNLRDRAEIIDTFADLLADPGVRSIASRLDYPIDGGTQ